MQLTAAASLLGSGLYLQFVEPDVVKAFAHLVLLGAVLGVVDILLFFKVDEPRVTKLPEAGLWEVFSGPFRHAGFRSFIGFTCFWHFAAMIGAPFISLYLLQYVGMSLFQVLLLWTCSWVGGAICSRWLGRIADHYGNRVLLILCIGLKSINMLSLLLVPPSPDLALVILAPIFMIDMALNTGVAIANNGFLLKHSPAANRTMFIAAGTAIAGLVGGMTSIACGAWLSSVSDWSMMIGSRSITGFHVLFFASLLARFVATVLVTRVQEPGGREMREVVQTLLGVGPLRVLRYPLGLYRRRWPGVEEAAEECEQVERDAAAA
ncbi:MAG: MFS transporter [Planctomycetaceae bacterium]